MRTYAYNQFFWFFILFFYTVRIYYYYYFIRTVVYTVKKKKKIFVKYTRTVFTCSIERNMSEGFPRRVCVLVATDFGGKFAFSATRCVCVCVWKIRKFKTKRVHDSVVNAIIFYCKKLPSYWKSDVKIDGA